MKKIIAGILIGLGLGIGCIPLIIASFIMGDNLIVEIIDRMDTYWKEK